MQRLKIRGTDLDASAVGLGCVGLTTMGSPNDALALLQHAFDAGITHFDVARAYGGGHAEQILGRFLKGRRDQVTVTTKFGIAPAAFVPRSAALVSMAKRVLRRVPMIERRVRRYAQPQIKQNAFGAREAESSLVQSLRELDTDHVEILLLHEGTLGDARNDELREFLGRQVERGTVRFYGMGSNVDRLGGDIDAFPNDLRIFQFENDAVSQQKRSMRGSAARGVITHSALKPLIRIVDAAQQLPELSSEFHSNTGYDLCRTADVSRLLLEFVRLDNEGGVVLFGSTRREHVSANVRVFEEPIDANRVESFRSAIERLFPQGNAVLAR